MTRLQIWHLAQTLEAAGANALKARYSIALKAADSVGEGAPDPNNLHPDELDKLPLLKVTHAVASAGPGMEIMPSNTAKLPIRRCSAQCVQLPMSRAELLL